MSADWYYDSCDTNWIIAGGASAGVTGGIIAAMLTKHAAGRAILIVVGAVQAIGAACIGAAKANSSLNAVIIKIRYNYLVWAAPQ